MTKTSHNNNSNSNNNNNNNKKKNHSNDSNGSNGIENVHKDVDLSSGIKSISKIDGLPIANVNIPVFTSNGNNKNEKSDLLLDKLQIIDLSKVKISWKLNDFVIQDENDKQEISKMNDFLLKCIINNEFGYSIDYCIQVLIELLKLFIFNLDSITSLLIDKNIIYEIEDGKDIYKEGNENQLKIRQLYSKLYSTVNNNNNNDKKSKNPLLLQDPKDFINILKTINCMPNSIKNSAKWKELEAFFIFKYVGDNDLVKKELVQDSEYSFFKDFFHSEKKFISFILGDLFKYVLLVKTHTVEQQGSIAAKKFDISKTRESLLLADILSSISGNFNCHSLFGLEYTWNVGHDLRENMLVFEEFILKFYSDIDIDLSKIFEKCPNHTCNTFHYDKIYYFGEKYPVSPLISEDFHSKDNLHFPTLIKILGSSSKQHPYLWKVANLLIHLADPVTQLSPTDTRIVSLDYLSDVFIGSISTFHFNEHCNTRDGTDFFKISMLLLKIINFTLPVLCLKDSYYDTLDKLQHAESTLKEDNWKDSIENWFPVDMDITTLENIYMMNILATFSLFKISKIIQKKLGIKYNISPFATFFVKLWTLQTCQIHLGMFIDERVASEQNDYKIPDSIKAVIRGNAAWRCVVVLFLHSQENYARSDKKDEIIDGNGCDDFYETVKHDYVHQSFNSFMSPHGRKLSNGELNIDEMKYEIITEIYTDQRYLLNKDFLDETHVETPNTSSIFKFFYWPQFSFDNYDEEAKFMFDWEYDLYNPDNTNDGIPSCAEAKRCFCMINANIDDDEDNESDVEDDYDSDYYYTDMKLEKNETAVATTPLEFTLDPEYPLMEPNAFVVKELAPGFQKLLEQGDYAEQVRYLNTLVAFHRSLQQKSKMRVFRDFRISLANSFHGNYEYFFKGLRSNYATQKFTERILDELTVDPLNYKLFYRLCSKYTAQDLNFVEYMFDLLLNKRVNLKDSVFPYVFSAVGGPVLTNEQGFQCFSRMIKTVLELEGDASHDIAGIAAIKEKIGDFIIESCNSKTSTIHKVFSQTFDTYVDSEHSEKENTRFYLKMDNFSNRLLSLDGETSEGEGSSDVEKMVKLAKSKSTWIYGTPSVKSPSLEKKSVNHVEQSSLPNQMEENLYGLINNKDDFTEYWSDICQPTELYQDCRIVDHNKYVYKEGIKPLEMQLSVPLVDLIDP